MRSALRELWTVRSASSDDVKVVADLLAQSMHDANLREPLATYYRIAFSQVEEHLKTAQSLGLRSKIDPKFVPRILHALLDGFALQKIVDPESIGDDQVVNALEVLAASLFEFQNAPPALDPLIPVDPERTEPQT
jgi:hypothetical protein